MLVMCGAVCEYGPKPWHVPSHRSDSGQRKMPKTAGLPQAKRNNPLGEYADHVDAPITDFVVDIVRPICVDAEAPLAGRPVSQQERVREAQERLGILPCQVGIWGMAKAATRLGTQRQESLILTESPRRGNTSRNLASATPNRTWMARHNRRPPQARRRQLLYSHDANGNLVDRTATLCRESCQVDMSLTDGSTNRSGGTRTTIHSERLAGTEFDGRRDARQRNSQTITY